jgi:hypothetical protein
LGIATVAGIGEAIRDLQWIWDKSKTKTGTKARSLQEALPSVIGIMRDGLEGRIHTDKWLGSARELTRNLEALRMMVEALDIGVDVQDYPQLCQQVDYVPETREVRSSDGAEMREVDEGRGEPMPEL